MAGRYRLTPPHATEPGIAVRQVRLPHDVDLIRVKERLKVRFPAQDHLILLNSGPDLARIGRWVLNEGCKPVDRHRARLDGGRIAELSIA